jgi:predicted MFS family arabinose efflux permease
VSRPAGALSYAVLLRTPGAPRAFVSSTLARLSYGTIALALLLTVQRATGSYAVAGTCLGAYGAPTVLGPLRSRLIDRRGVRPVLFPLSFGYAVALGGVAWCAVAGVRLAAAYAACAFVAGLLAPPVGPVMRAIWASLTPDAAARTRAYSLDAVVEELVLAAGPVVVGLVVAIASPVASLVVSALLALAGSVGLGLSPLAAAQTQQPTSGEATETERRRFLGPLRVPEFRVVLLVMLAIGAGFGSLDLAVVARTGNGPAAGYVLAALSAGSAIGGLAWGRLRHESSYRRQSTGLLVALVAGMLALSAVGGVPWTAVLLGLTGLAVAPLFVLAFVAADDLVPPGSRTEATTWVATAANVGAALGSALFGVVVEATSARTTLLVGAALVASAIPLLAVRRRPPA